MTLDLVARTAGTQDFNVLTRHLCGFEDRLAAAAARGADEIAGKLLTRTVASSDCDPRDLVEPEGMLRGCERALLSAEAEAVASVFHVGASHNLAIYGLYRASDREAGIGRISAQCGLTGLFDQLAVVHEARP